MNRRTWSRIWIVLGAGLLVIAGLMVLLTFMKRGPAAPAPTAPVPSPTPVPKSSPTAVPSPTTDPVAASVNGRDITYSYWREAVALNQVLSALAGEPPLEQDETLQRLIKQELVLQAASPEQKPTTEEIEGYIARLEQAWDMDDDEMAAALDSAGIERAFFEETIRRLLTVQAGVRSINSEGHDTQEWLQEQWKSVDVKISRDVPTPVAPTIEAVVKQTASSTPVEATETPASTSEMLSVAPDFTLKQSGGGTFTLSKQLARGSVVLAFFRRGGG